MMNYEQAISYLRTIEYPYEILPPEDESFVAIQSASGVKFEKVNNYIYLSKFKPSKSKYLGLYVIDRDTMNLCHSLSSAYSMSARIHSRRCDSLSAYDYWTANKTKVLDQARQQLITYHDTHKPENVPIDMGGVPSNTNYLGLQHECALSLFRLGIPASFASNLVVKVIKDHYNDIELNTLRVLDISAGWGDRLLACCSLGVEYTACDPNTALVDSYKNIIKK